MKRSLLVVAFVACAAITSNAARAQPAQDASKYSANVAIEWFQLDLQLIQQTPGFSPPVAARALGYLGLALYESVVPGMPAHRSLAGQLNELDSLPWAQPDEALHWPTVANAALAAMTRMMFPTASAENKTRIDLLERNLPLKYPQEFDPATVTAEITQRSESFGKLMAMALMTWARTDGGHEAWGPLRRSQANYVPPSGAGQWSATPPTFAPALLPWWGENRPFVLKGSDACPAPAPPPYSEASGSPFYKEAEEVWRIANAATQAQRQYALYWADDPGKTPTPAGHWVHIAGGVLKARKATLADAAETYARLTLAMNDAFIAAWRSKYQINLLRPCHLRAVVHRQQLDAATDEHAAVPGVPVGALGAVGGGGGGAVEDVRCADRIHRQRAQRSRLGAAHVHELRRSGGRSGAVAAVCGHSFPQRRGQRAGAGTLRGGAGVGVEDAAVRAAQ